MLRILILLLNSTKMCDFQPQIVFFLTKISNNNPPIPFHDSTDHWHEKKLHDWVKKSWQMYL